MPYITQPQRDKIDGPLKELVEAIDVVLKEGSNEENIGGILNYTITRLIDDSVVPMAYMHFERAIGMLECCKLELYRRRIAPYEDRKLLANGDVWPAD